MQVSTEKVVEDAKKHALMTGMHYPTLIANTELGSGMLILHDLPENHDEKMLVMMGAGNKLREEGTAGKYLFKTYLITEGWMSTSIKPEDYKKGNFTRPSEDPNRIECLIITSLEMGKEAKNEGYVFKMIRNKDGKLINLEDLHQGEDKSHSMESPLLKAFFVGFYEGDKLDLGNKILMDAIPLKK